MKNRYFPTAVGLYFNYFVHGMGVILMSLNMSSLEQQWHTSAAGVSIVISSLGIGRLSVLLIAGMLFQSLWSPSFYHSGDRLLPDFFHWHSLCSDDFCRLCLWLFSGYGQQFFRCRYLSQFDGSLPSLPQYGKYSDQSILSLAGNCCCPLLLVY